jgi:hypothetical protein
VVLAGDNVKFMEREGAVETAGLWPRGTGALWPDATVGFSWRRR